MRILLTSDLHYKLRQYDWVIDAASNFDAVVIAGDHIDAFSPVPGIVQIAALSASFTAVSRASRLMLCSGNHDLNARNHAGEKTADWLDGLRTAAVAVDGDTVTVADTLFTVCPWWDGPYARAALEQKLESASRQRRGRWVWVYHAPPEGALSWTGKRYYGDAVLANWLSVIPRLPFYVGIYTKRPLRRAVHGLTALVKPGCSMQVARSAILRHASK
jgi:hypothetical protein